MKANKAVLGSLHFLLPIPPLSKREKKIFEKYLRKKRTNKSTLWLYRNVEERCSTKIKGLRRASRHFFNQRLSKNLSFTFST
jgi:hypothetical protein